MDGAAFLLQEGAGHPHVEIAHSIGAVSRFILLRVAGITKLRCVQRFPRGLEARPHHRLPFRRHGFHQRRQMPRFHRRDRHHLPAARPAAFLAGNPMICLLYLRRRVVGDSVRKALGIHQQCLRRAKPGRYGEGKLHGNPANL